MTPPQTPSHEFTEDREARYALFTGLLARHDQSIRRFVRSLLPKSEGVDDVVQETALECWKKFSSFQPESPESAADEFIRWACVIARYEALTWQRDRARDRLVFRESVVERLAEAATEQLGQQQAEGKALERCLGGLQEDQRRLLMSVYSPEDSIARIASETGERARRLYSKINMLRKLLLNCVQQRLTREVGHG
ncbi:sigma-70 family RNA polymerase sigma factor [Calycomorphotria hydatis]|uniref:RNA polymerase sigma factor n=1 Tax=Calycomorphotria hydatis TaxID=2528027 RepID=A0A517TD91_9PLAN|nr:sigma-70 family RNA polymerase sigma factor [Calycomorphotria hydatis]QDT66334.1 RNA polymerase sigma factor [Calycomorphotria hydatis]